jgi:cellulose biosynthesis protein BcsQ
MGFIISIVNNKGGVGKTLTSCNLADSLGKQNKRVLVIDIDSQCNTTSLLLPKGMTIRHTLYDILNPNTAPRDLNPFIYPTDCKNVSLIPNISDTATLEPDIITSAPDSFFRLRKVLRNYAVEEFDFTLIDNPPNMGSFVMCSLYASDFAIIPIKAGSAFSVEGLIKATKLIEDIRSKGNGDLRFLRLLINCLDARTAISKAIAEQIRNTFDPDQIFETEVPVNTAFEKAEALKKTIFQHDGTASGARAFRKLAKELISILKG